MDETRGKEVVGGGGKGFLQVMLYVEKRGLWMSGWGGEGKGGLVRCGGWVGMHRQEWKGRVCLRVGGVTENIKPGFYDSPFPRGL